MEESALTTTTVTSTEDAIELAVITLVELGKKYGYLTWEQLNEALPDEAVSPDHLEAVLLRIEEHKIDMVDEIEAERLESRRKSAKGKSKKGRRRG